MKGKGVSTLKIAGAYIGTVVGAGFATGQEILQFFAVFGVNGLWGILASTVLFIVFGVIIMAIGLRVHARSHVDILKHSGGKWFTAIMDVAITFCLFGSLTAMMAGCGALFRQQFGLPAVLGSLVMALFTAITVLSGIHGVINAISAVVPFLLTSVIGISLYSILNTPPDMSAAPLAGENPFLGGWAQSALLYASYNIVMSIGVLGPLGACAKDRRAITWGGFLGGLGLGVGQVCICLALLGNMVYISGMEVPMAYIAGKISYAVQLIYSIILIAEIYTTAVGSLYGFTARITHRKQEKSKGTLIIIGTSVAAFFASLLGFSNLVRYFYPLVGYGGIVVLICLVFGRNKAA